MKTKIMCLLLALNMFVLSPAMDTYAAETPAYDADAAAAFAEANWDSGVGVCDEYVKDCMAAGGLTVRAGGVEPIKDALLDLGAGPMVELALDADGVHINQKDNPTVKPGDIMFFACGEENNWIHIAIAAGVDEQGNIQAYGHNPGWDRLDYFGRLTFTKEGKAHKECMRFYVVQMNTSGSHVHTWNKDLYENEHPHRMYDQCADCGASYYLGWNATVSTCTVCNPPLGDCPQIVDIHYDEAAGGVCLQWSTVEHTTEYEVLRADSIGTYYSLGKLNAVTMFNDSVEPGAEYSYKVVAHPSGAESEAKTCTIPGQGSTKPELSVSYDEGSRAVKLSWTKVTNATGYDVYRAKSLDGAYTKLTKTSITGTTLTNASVEAGETYYYKVVAKVSGGESASDVVSITVPGEAVTKAELSAVYDSASKAVKLTWTKVTGAKEYEVYRAKGQKTNYTKLNVVTGTSLTNGSVEEGETYYYKVRAVLKDGTYSEESDAVKCTIPGQAVTKAELSAVYDSTAKAVKLTWTKVTGATGYEVYRAKGQPKNYTKLNTVTGTSFTNSSVEAGETYYYKVVAKPSGAESNVKSVSIPGKKPEPKPQNPVETFVTRLYEVCLNRKPDALGLADWSKKLTGKQIDGITAAYGFVFSQEFTNKNLCNEDYVKQLYSAFLGRKPDALGLADWVKQLENGTTREDIFNGFALSQEFKGLCEQYGINQGAGIDVSGNGTVPSGKCAICGKTETVTVDGVTGFVKRLYKVCLNRQADAAGLEDWTGKLKAHKATGRSVAYGFIFSQEFINKNYSNADYVEHLYLAFMGRGSDPAGKSDWIKRMEKDKWTREQVFDGFVGSQEFTGICESYGITRD